MKIYDMRSEALYAGVYIPSILGYYYRWFPVEYSMEAHRHRQVEIMYVEHGSCVTEVEGLVLPMEKGQFVLINGDVEHRLLVIKGVSCRILNIEFVFMPTQDTFFSFGAFCSKAFDHHPDLFLSPPYYHLLKDDGEIHGILKKMVTELDSRGEMAKISINLLFWQLLLQIQRSLQAARLIANDPRAGYVQNAMKFMQNNYHKTINVETVADALKINRSYFHRIFKEYTGTTPIAYLTNIRMERAKSLLLQTNLPMREIARNVGIHSQQYFNYLFKKETARSPRLFKQSFEIDPVPNRLT